MAKKKNKFYVLTTDFDSHWYVVAKDDLEAFYNLLDSDPDGTDFYDLDVTSVNGHASTIIFKEWEFYENT